jgi:CMP-N,N'-diacetyllegionaminic acid synthase
MFKKIKVVALIPAKHKSHDLPKKNYLKLNNLSLFEIAIQSALHSKFVDQIYVTSDSLSILKQSKKSGSNIIKRNKNLCQKNTPANKVILHSIKSIKKKITENFILLYLQPTSPFRNHKHIDKIFNLLKSNKVNSAISVTKQKKTIFKGLRIKDGLIKPIFKESFVTANRQELETTYIPNGAIYIFDSNIFIKNKKIPIKNSLAYKMSEKSSHDIDNINDFNFAKKMSNKLLIYKKKNEKNI